MSSDGRADSIPRRRLVRQRPACPGPSAPLTALPVAETPSTGNANEVVLWAVGAVCLTGHGSFGSQELGRRDDSDTQRSLVLFASFLTPNRQDRDIRQHDTSASVTSFVSTSGPLLMYDGQSPVEYAFQRAFVVAQYTDAAAGSNVTNAAASRPGD
ncbi:hypothetical protein HPB47_004817 [Ixodes persulcatus]|uniref:Uncharacterized protein n=1 Tax=Ixodes persulcatus TaxID=34615 RepID=A0AC60PG05_IXOPE|nr:hypothetical protein HPB47_004817 [Ixodes persulcatus]